MQLFRAGGVGPWKTYKITENGFKLWSLEITVGVLVVAAMLGAAERANAGLTAGFQVYIGTKVRYRTRANNSDRRWWHK